MILAYEVSNGVGVSADVNVPSASLVDYALVFIFTLSVVWVICGVIFFIWFRRQKALRSKVVIYTILSLVSLLFAYINVTQVTCCIERYIFSSELALVVFLVIPIALMFLLRQAMKDSNKVLKD